MALRDDANLPAVVAYERRDDVRAEVGLARTGWTLHGQVRAVEVEQACHDGGNVVGFTRVAITIAINSAITSAVERHRRERGAASSARWQAAQKVADGLGGPLGRF